MDKNDMRAPSFVLIFAAAFARTLSSSSVQGLFTVMDHVLLVMNTAKNHYTPTFLCSILARIQKVVDILWRSIQMF
jgi:hypothetical protein